MDWKAARSDPKNSEVKHLINTEDFLDKVLALLSKDIQKKLPALRETVVNSGRRALRTLAADLERWNFMLAAGTITSKEYEWLVQGRVALIQIQSLKASGLALARLDEFRNSLVRAIVGAAVASIGI